MRLCDAFNQLEQSIQSNKRWKASIILQSTLIKEDANGVYVPTSLSDNHSNSVHDIDIVKLIKQIKNEDSLLKSLNFCLKRMFLIKGYEGPSSLVSVRQLIISSALQCGTHLSTYKSNPNRRSYM